MNMHLMEYKAAASMLKSYGIGSVESKYVGNADEAVKFANGSRIVLKVMSNRALHKSKAGLVKLDLQEEDDVRKAFNELVSKARRFAPYRILAQKMASNGVEVIIGGRQDQQFGKLILLGLGGIYVETFKDFALRVCPITNFDAREMIEQMRSKSIITYNGRATRILVGLLLKASRLITERDLAELDLNPVILRENGYDVVDIRVLK